MNRHAPWKRTAILVTMVFCAGACASDEAGQRPDEAIRALPQCDAGLPMAELFGVWQLLSYHEARISAEGLRQASSDPAAALIFLYARDDLLPSTRLRSLEAMAFVPDQRVEIVYEKLLASKDGSDDQHKAIIGFARAWPEKALRKLSPHLTTPVDPQIRLTAAQALSTFCGDEGRKVVVQAADLELEAWVKEGMLKYAAPDIVPKSGPVLPEGLR